MANAHVIISAWFGRGQGFRPSSGPAAGDRARPGTKFGARGEGYS